MSTPYADNNKERGAIMIGLINSMTELTEERWQRSRDILSRMYQGGAIDEHNN